MANMKTVCNECKKKEDNFKRKFVAKGIQEIYLECSDCKAKFHSYYENEKVKKLMAENQQLQIQARGKSKTYAIQKQINDNRRVIQKEQKKISKILANS